MLFADYTHNWGDKNHAREASEGPQCMSTHHEPPNSSLFMRKIPQ